MLMPHTPIKVVLGGVEGLTSARSQILALWPDDFRLKRSPSIDAKGSFLWLSLGRLGGS